MNLHDVEARSLTDAALADRLEAAAHDLWPDNTKRRRTISGEKADRLRALAQEAADRLKTCDWCGDTMGHEHHSCPYWPDGKRAPAGETEADTKKAEQERIFEGNMRSVVNYRPPKDDPSDASHD